MKQKSLYKLIALSLLSGASLAVPFLHFHAGWLSFVCALPFLYLLDVIVQQRISITRSGLLIWIVGLSMMSIVLFWAALIDAEFIAGGLSAITVTSGIILTYFIASFCLSAGFIAFASLFIGLHIRLNQKRVFILVPLAWIGCEWLRSWTYGIVTAGPNTSLGPHWNFGDLGFALAVTPFGYSGRLVGLYGLSAIVIIINLSVFWLFSYKNFRPLSIVLVMTTFVTGVGYVIYSQPNGQTVTAAALQMEYDARRYDTSESFANTQPVFNNASKVDILVLPEYAGIFDKADEDLDRNILKQVVTDSTAPIITSRERTGPAGKFNTLTAYNVDGNVQYQRDKRFLIPVGESVPYTYGYIYELLGKRQSVQQLQATREITRGSLPDRGYRAGNLHIASAACSATIAPDLYRQQVTADVELLTNSASVTMFANSPTYHQQNLQMARFIAVSNARPFIQATKAGTSIIVDHNGNILASSQRKSTQLIQSQVTTNHKQTPYSMFGELILWLSFVVLALYSIRAYKRR